MKILIVGGTSALGSYLKKTLSEFYEVITAGRRDCDITLDLNGPLESMILPDNLDVVVHTAANFGGKTDKEIIDAENINVLGTLKLCEAAFEVKSKHFILISSIFSSLKGNTPHQNIYSLSKKHSEEVAHFYCSTHSLPLTILKPSQLYGDDNSFRKHQPFFYTMVDKAEKGEDIQLNGSNDPLRNYIHINDLTHLIRKVLVGKIEGVYSCAHTMDVTYSQIAKAAFAAFSNGGRVYFLNDRANIPDNVYEKDDSLYELIGFYPQISIEEGLRRIANERASAK
jgi:nucleoside-diphosphate-sugar epimerase